MPSKFKVGDILVQTKKRKRPNNPDLKYIKIYKVQGDRYYYTCFYYSLKPWDQNWEIAEIDEGYRKLTKLELALK